MFGIIPGSGVSNKFDGSFFLGGRVTKAGAGAAGKVWVYDTATKQNIAVVYSDALGDWALNGVRANPVFVISFDEQGQYNAVIRDNVIPAPMP